MKINSFTLINAHFAQREISDFAQLEYPESSLRFFFHQNRFSQDQKCNHFWFFPNIFLKNDYKSLIIKRNAVM